MAITLNKLPSELLDLIFEFAWENSSLESLLLCNVDFNRRAESMIYWETIAFTPLQVISFCKKVLKAPRRGLYVRVLRTSLLMSGSNIQTPF